ncbi:hypothetical protein [Actinoplanes teichomyceticus]|uniref:Uncharacterized protein n=1 Tax=Actinoplanes teichomyceticus TaxID=1867 RepID=A0A561VIQ7_ACTTI|nr:hypothetical protein [Actinoplanes teichomyceticus]TWG11499.1 hypothetical protein FHX34_106229 [Actinoplanes teichomyceticus]GIF15687.1 hypothetical protein Ate01nite_57190 [Actinoplanes teichomyceticus]
MSDVDELEAVRRQAAVVQQTRKLVEEQVEVLRRLLPKAKATGRWSSNEIARAAAGGMARVRVLKEIGDDEILDRARKALRTWPHDLFELRFRNPALFIAFCRPGLEPGSPEARQLALDLVRHLETQRLWLFCEQDPKQPARGLAEGRTCAIVDAALRTEPRHLTP